MIPLTLTLLTISFLVLYKLYGINCIINPATSFILIWIFSVLSLYFFVNFIPGNAGIIIYPEFIDELLTYISFTAISVVLVNLLSYKKIKYVNISWSPNVNFSIFIKLIIILSFFASIIHFISIGTLDFGEIRSNYLESSDLLTKGKRELGLIEFVFNILNLFNIPLLIITSFCIGLKLATWNDLKKISIIYFLPLISGILNGISSGGRHILIDTLYITAIFIFVGMLKSKVSKKSLLSSLKKIVRFILLFFIVFSIYSTFIEGQRKTRTSLYFQDHTLLKPFSGLMTYLVAHYAGYQLHRHFSVTEKSEPGKKTLQGITKFELPYLSRIVGTSTSLGSILNIDKESKVGATEFNEMYVGWSNTTSTVFIQIYDDYGFYWSFLVIFLFVILSQYIFIKFLETKSSSYLIVFPYFIILFLWFNSIFSSEILGNWLGIKIFSFFIIHILLKRATTRRTYKVA